MATNLPVLGSTMHPASVTYACTFGLTQAGGGLVTFIVPQPVQFTFTFETGRVQPDPALDLINITSDSSWFDQDTEEASIRTALDGICTLIAAMLPGVTKAQIQATVSVRRTWRYNPDQAGSLAPVRIPDAPVPYVETMAYP
jgi:hypothetical protein